MLNSEYIYCAVRHSNGDVPSDGLCHHETSIIALWYNLPAEDTCLFIIAVQPIIASQIEYSRKMACCMLGIHGYVWKFLFDNLLEIEFVSETIFGGGQISHEQ